MSLSRLSDSIIELHTVLLNSHFKEALKDYNLINCKNDDIIINMLENVFKLYG